MPSQTDRQTHRHTDTDTQTQTHTHTHTHTQTDRQTDTQARGCTDRCSIRFLAWVVLGSPWVSCRPEGSEPWVNFLELVGVGSAVVWWRGSFRGADGGGPAASKAQKSRKGQVKKAYSTGYSQAVSHPSTNQA